MASIFNFVTKEGKHFAPIVNEVPSGFRVATAEEIADTSITKYPSQNGQTTIDFVSTSTRIKSGAKGVFAKVRLENNSQNKAELFAVNTQAFLSSN